MSGSVVSRCSALGALALLLLVGVLAAVPAEADADGYTSWVSREDAAVVGTGTTYSWSGDDAGMRARMFPGEDPEVLDLHVVTSGTTLEHGIGLQLTPPKGQVLEAGATYQVFVGGGAPTAALGRLLLWRDGEICGRTEADFGEWWMAPPFATGTIRISEFETDGLDTVTRFAATYELSCQTLGDPPGLEGSIALNATRPPSAVPAEPAVPGPVTELAITNVVPNNRDYTISTLTWRNPVGTADVVVDMVQSEHREKLPDLVGGELTLQFRGTTSRYSDGKVEWMDTRTYRVVPRGPTGRLGAPRFVTIQGSRLDVKDWLTQPVTIGQSVEFSGRLRFAWDHKRVSDVMKGPGLANRVIELCARPIENYSNQPCTPIDRTRTSADGSFTLTGTPLENLIYDFEVPATDQALGNTLRATAWVAPVTDLTAPESEGVAAPRFARAAGRASVRRGSVIHFSTVRAPAGSRGVVRLQRYDGHSWRTVLTKRFGTRGSGARRIAIPYRERSKGPHLYRVVKLADKRHVDGHSRTVRVRVR